MKKGKRTSLTVSQDTIDWLDEVKIANPGLRKASYELVLRELINDNLSTFGVMLPEYKKAYAERREYTPEEQERIHDLGTKAFLVEERRMKKKKRGG